MMTRDEIIKMARQAGFDPHDMSSDFTCNLEDIIAFAKLVAAGCAECGVNGGHALYCVACAEKFVGGYKDSGVPAVKTELEQASPDTPPQRTWVGLTDAEVEGYWDWEDFQTGAGRLTIFEMVRDIEAKLKEKNNA
jgi:hypothetical protein